MFASQLELKHQEKFMTFAGKTILGKSGLSVNRLGIASSFGAPAEAYEEAFERGCNYFTWGTFIKGASSKLVPAIKNICAKGKRQDLILAVLSYAHQARLTEYFIQRHLKTKVSAGFVFCFHMQRLGIHNYSVHVKHHRLNLF